MAAEPSTTRLLVDSTGAGRRIDRYLAAVLPELSRSYIQQLIGDGHIRVNDAIVKASYRAEAGDAVAVTLPLPRPADIVPEDLPLVIRYEDADLLVVDKPAGMVVHPAPGHTNGTLVNALLYHYPDMRIGDDLRPGIVHRIDRDTSGLLVVAKNDRAKAALQAQQQARQMRKVYLGLIEGNFREPNGTIDAPIDRHPSDRLRMGVVAGGGRRVPITARSSRWGRTAWLKHSWRPVARTRFACIFSTSTIRSWATPYTVPSVPACRWDSHDSSCMRTSLASAMSTTSGSRVSCRCRPSSRLCSTSCACATAQQPTWSSTPSSRGGSLE